MTAAASRLNAGAESPQGAKTNIGGFMKKLIVVAALLVSGCDINQSPDFSKPLKVEIKYSDKEVALYTVKNTYGNKGLDGSGWGAVQFKAPSDFAKAGQYIIFKDGVLMAVDKKPKKEKK